jgi:hypothetical protein
VQASKNLVQHLRVYSECAVRRNSKNCIPSLKSQDRSDRTGQDKMSCNFWMNYDIKLHCGNIAQHAFPLFVLSISCAKFTKRYELRNHTFRPKLLTFIITHVFPFLCIHISQYISFNEHHALILSGGGGVGARLSMPRFSGGGGGICTKLIAKNCIYCLLFTSSERRKTKAQTQMEVIVGRKEGRKE